MQTWQQLAAVAEPAHGSGRILIIASAGVCPRRGAAIIIVPSGHSPLAVPTAKRRGGGLQNTVTTWVPARHRPPRVGMRLDEASKSFARSSGMIKSAEGALTIGFSNDHRASTMTI